MAKTNGKTIVFIGDSITEGVGASSVDNCWASLVTKEGEFAKGHNFGVSGTRIAWQKEEKCAEWNENFVERIDRLPEKTDFVLVFGGTNDYGHGDAPLGKLGDKTTETFYGAMDVLLVKLLEKYPEARIALLTPIHRDKEELYYNDFGVRNCGTLETYVNAEKAVCAKYGIPVLDLYTTSGICPANPVNMAIYTTDGVHPNDRGYRLIADKVLQFIKNIL